MAVFYANYFILGYWRLETPLPKAVYNISRYRDAVNKVMKIEKRYQYEDRKEISVMKIEKRYPYGKTCVPGMSVAENVVRKYPCCTKSSVGIAVCAPNCVSWICKIHTANIKE